MKKIILLTILLASLNSLLWSDDISIADNLLNYYLDRDLELEDLNKVMEFNSENSIALIEKAKLIKGKISLYRVKSLLERSTFVTENSKVMYVNTLYQLKDYTTLIEFYNSNDFSTDLPVIFYYQLINSLIFLNKYEDAKELYSKYHSYFKKTTEFLELGYLLIHDRGTLDELLKREAYSAIIRLYNRVNHDDLLELYIYRFIDKLDSKVVANYKLLNLLLSIYSMRFDGNMTLDTDSDGIIDTEMIFDNNILVSKEIDLDQDDVYDYSLVLKNGIPLSMEFQGKRVLFINYPYIDSVITNEGYTIHYKLSETQYKYIIKNPIIQIPDLKVFDIDMKDINVDWIKEFDEKNLTKMTYVLNKSDYLVYEDYRDSRYYKISHYVNGVLYRSLMDLDYDTIFDYFELYNSDSLLLSAYSKNGDMKNIDKLEMSSESDEKNIEEISFNWNSYIEK